MQTRSPISKHIGPRSDKMAPGTKENFVPDRGTTGMNENETAEAHQTVPYITEPNSTDFSVWETIKKNPVIVLYCFYANLGAFMYGFDNITLSLCLDMVPFV